MYVHQCKNEIPNCHPQASIIPKFYVKELKACT